MDMDLASASKSGSARPLRARIPFVSTSFAQNLWYYALVWPMWWVLGIEQLLLPFFVLYETARFLIRSHGRIRINTTTVLGLLLALWWLVPIIWVDREFLDIFLKEASSIWSQALMLILFLNCLKTRREWWLAAGALTLMAVYTAAAGLIFAAGVWRGEFTSVLGGVLPASLVENSAFFSSIAIRRFGFVGGETGLLPLRLMGVSLSFSSLSMICLLLIPLIYWRFQIARGTSRLLYLGVLGGLLICLLFAESRISYLAFFAGIALYCTLRLGLLREPNRFLTIGLALIGIGGGLLFGYLALGSIIDALQAAFIDLRPSSWLVRFNIYIVTLRLLPDHLIAGWGVPVRIPGASNVYSAGTHSSYLGMLFQHGIVGLGLYLALWISLWKYVIVGLRRRSDRTTRLFWIAIAVAFFAFNIREIADTWWWDQSLMYVIWIIWGITITANRIQLVADSEAN